MKKALVVSMCLLTMLAAGCKDDAKDKDGNKTPAEQSKTKTDDGKSDDAEADDSQSDDGKSDDSQSDDGQSDDGKADDEGKKDDEKPVGLNLPCDQEQAMACASGELLLDCQGQVWVKKLDCAALRQGCKVVGNVGSCENNVSAGSPCNPHVEVAQKCGTDNHVLYCPDYGDGSTESNWNISEQCDSGYVCAIYSDYDADCIKPCAETDKDSYDKTYCSYSDKYGRYLEFDGHCVQDEYGRWQIQPKSDIVNVCDSCYASKKCTPTDIELINFQG